MLRLGVVGLGWWGKQIVRSLAASARLKVVYGTDLATEPLEDFAARNDLLLLPDYPTLLERPDIDAVVIATPHSQHESQVLAAILAGKQIFCEKPLAMSVGGVRRILDACSAHGLILGIGHERRFEPALEEASRLITSGELGTLIALDANVSHDLFQKMPTHNWRRQKSDAPAGLYTGVGVHLTDIFVALAGPVAWVQAWSASRIFEPPAEDVLTAKIGFVSGVHAFLTCLSATPYYGRFTAQGSRGWVEVIEGGNVDRGLPSELISCNAAGERIRRSYAPSNTVLLNFEAWADAVEGRAAYRISFDDILENTKIFEGIVCSAAEKGSPVIFNLK